MTAIVVHRCAWCDEDLTRFNMLADAHRAVCPKRPIEAGDYVHWCFAERGTWADGEVTAWMPRGESCPHDRITIRVAAHSGGWGEGIADPVAVGREHTFGCEERDGIFVRRIPRPAARIEAAVRGAQQPQAEPPAPVLVDGLTREQCLAAYTCAQNEELPGGVEFLTDAQRTAGQEEWSAALRAKVAGGSSRDAATWRVEQERRRREVERNRVWVDVQDE